MRPLATARTLAQSEPLVCKPLVCKPLGSVRPILGRSRPVGACGREAAAALWYLFRIVTEGFNAFDYTGITTDGLPIGVQVEYTTSTGIVRIASLPVQYMCLLCTARCMHALRARIHALDVHA